MTNNQTANRLGSPEAIAAFDQIHALMNQAKEIAERLPSIMDEDGHPTRPVFIVASWGSQDGNRIQMGEMITARGDQKIGALCDIINDMPKPQRLRVMLAISHPTKSDDRPTAN